jgi:hypothetical protein
LECLRCVYKRTTYSIDAHLGRCHIPPWWSVIRWEVTQQNKMSLHYDKQRPQSDQAEATASEKNKNICEALNDVNETALMHKTAKGVHIILMITTQERRKMPTRTYFTIYKTFCIRFGQVTLLLSYCANVT